MGNVVVWCTATMPSIRWRMTIAAVILPLIVIVVPVLIFTRPMVISAAAAAATVMMIIMVFVVFIVIMTTIAWATATAIVAHIAAIAGPDAAAVIWIIIRWPYRSIRTRLIWRCLVFLLENATSCGWWRVIVVEIFTHWNRRSQCTQCTQIDFSGWTWQWRCWCKTFGKIDVIEWFTHLTASKWFDTQRRRDITIIIIAHRVNAVSSLIDKNIKTN